MRFLLSNLLCKDPETTEELENAIPDIHCVDDLNAILNREMVIVKSHLMMNNAMRSLSRKTSFIYVVRNPLDLIFSNFNHLLLTSYSMFADLTLAELDQIKSHYIDQFLDWGGDRRWIDLGIGRWTQHVESWLNNACDLPWTVVRYEDLLENPHLEMQNIANFLELTIDPVTLEVAIANSSFQNMKKFEEETIAKKEQGIFYHPNFEQAHQAGIRFVNQGRAGDANSQLSTAQLQRARTTFSPYMQVFGYL